MSFPTWDGGKDKGAFRTLSDVAGGTDGIRTVTQTQGDTTTTLRTRAGNPEMVIRKKGGVVEFVEASYKSRKYLAATGSEAVPVTGGSKEPKKTMSTIAFRLRSITLKVLGKLTFKVPPDTVTVFDGTWRDDSDRTWKDPDFSHSEFHKPVLHSTSDGVFTFVAHSPKSAASSVGALRFKPVEKLLGTTPLADLTNNGEGFIKRYFYDPIVMRSRAGNRFRAYHFAFVVAPIKKVITSGAGKELTFAKPSADDPEDLEYGSDNCPHLFGEPYGKTVLKFNPFDHVIVFGQPWHGHIDMVTQRFNPDSGGSLLLSARNAEGEQLFGEMYPSTLTGSYVDGNPFRDASGFVQYVEFNDLPDVPNLSAYDVETDASFKKYAVLCGSRRQYTPASNGRNGAGFATDTNSVFLNDERRDSGCFGVNTWLYRTAQGVVWCLWVRYVWLNPDGLQASSKIEVWGRRVADRYGDFEMILSESPPDDGHRFTDLGPFAVTSSATGAKALVSTHGIGDWFHNGERELGRVINVVDGAGYFDKPVLVFDRLTFASVRTSGPTAYVSSTEQLGEFNTIYPAAFWISKTGEVQIAEGRQRAFGLSSSPHPTDGLNMLMGLSYESYAKKNGVVFRTTSYSIAAHFETIGDSVFHVLEPTVQKEIVVNPYRSVISGVGMSTMFHVQEWNAGLFDGVGAGSVVYAKAHSLSHGNTLTTALHTPAWTYFIVDDPVSNNFLIDKWPW